MTFILTNVLLFFMTLFCILASIWQFIQFINYFAYRLSFLITCLKAKKLEKK